MAPTATLRDLLAALAAQDREAAYTALETLLHGLSCGGAFPKMPAPSVETGYQGWTNYETWAVHRWLTGHHDTANVCRDLALEARVDAPDAAAETRSEER